MRVFVTGPTGYIGSAVVRALVRAGHSVLALARSEERLRPLAADVTPVLGNLRDARAWAHEAARADAFVHAGAEPSADMPAVDAAALDALLHAAAKGDGPRRLVYTSGVWVLGETGEAPVDETAPTDHPAPLVAWRVGHEARVLDAATASLSTLVIRPAIVFGGRGGILDGFFAAARRDGKPTVVGSGHNRWPGVHRDDAADLYVRALEMAFDDRVRSLPAKSRVFHAASGLNEPVADVARAASRAAGGEDAVHFRPLDEARETLGAFADCLALDQAVSATRSETVLGWRPRFRGFVPNAAELFAEWSR